MVYAVLPFIIGIIFGGLFPGILFPLICLCIILLFFFKILSPGLQVILFCFILFFTGWIRISYSNIGLERIEYSVKKFKEKSVNVSGIVHSSNDTKNGIKLLVNLLEINSEVYNKTGSINCFVYHKHKVKVVQGDTILASGLFQLFDEPRNPGEFDFRRFFNRKNIFGKIIIHRDTPLRIKKSKTKSLEHWISITQKKIKTIFDIYLDQNTSGLMAGLILGDKSEINPDIRLSFSDAGVIHILAVSGLHVGYVLMILMIITSFFGIPWGWNKIPIILGLIAYMFITGLRPSVMRASFMAIIFVVSVIFNRKANLWNIISFVGLFILIIQPLYLMDLGFQLSFSAVLSIVFFLNITNFIFPKSLQISNMENSIFKSIWALFLVSFGAQIGTLPLTAAYFGKIPLLSIFTNIIIVPLVGILVALGFILLLVSGVPVFAETFANSIWLIAELIQKITQFVASLPISIMYISKINWTDFVSYFLIIGFILFYIYTKRFSIILCGMLILVSIVIWKWALFNPKMNILFLDVGQGDAAIVQFPNQKTMLIDAGQRFKSKDYGKKVVIPVSKYLGIKSFDWVVMSHPHNDHIGGIISVIEDMKVDTLFDTFGGYESWTYQKIIDEAIEHNIFYRKLNKGEILYPDKNISFSVFAPDSSTALSETNINNRSIVFKLEYNLVSILFTGDLELEGESKLIHFGDELKSDILKVGHHGSITSSTNGFLTLVRPELAVISVGRKNKFNHPSPVVINRMENLNISYHRTDIDKALWIEIDGNTYMKKIWN
jgi:competence protein ComEC